MSVITVGWTDAGDGWKRERQSADEIPDRYWAAATAQSAFVPRPPQRLRELTGIPIWSLSAVSIGPQPHWCFSVQGGGGTVQFAFVHGRHSASVVWRAAAALIGRSAPDRLPWGRSSVEVPAVPAAPAGDPVAFARATTELLMGLRSSASGMWTVRAGPELMAVVIPAVLTVVPARSARQVRWHTCLLTPAGPAREWRNTVTGEWSPQMRRTADEVAVEVGDAARRAGRRP